MESNLGQRNSNSCVTLRRGESNVSSNVVSEVNSCELKRTNRKQAATIVNAEPEEFKKLVQNTCNVDRRNSLESGLRPDCWRKSVRIGDHVGQTCVKTHVRACQSGLRKTLLM